MSKRTVIYPSNTSQFLRGDATFETAGGGGGSKAVSGSNGSFTFDTVTFGNLNGMSFYTSNGSLVGSYTVPATGAAITISDAATSGTIGRLEFTNLNGVTLSLSSGAAGSHTIVGSHNALTSQSNQAFSADASSTFQTLSLQNSNGISFSNNAGAVRLTHDRSASRKAASCGEPEATTRARPRSWWRLSGVLLWQIPAGIADLKIEHRHLLNVLQIQCVHDAKNNQERDECLTLELRR